jgi:flagellar basal-body rod modification protein FlgD
MGSLSEGEGTFSWDGKNLDGQPLPEGDYTFTIAATDSSGESIDITTLVRGVVDSMDFSEGSASPTIDGVPVDMASIVRLDNGG